MDLGIKGAFFHEWTWKDRCGKEYKKKGKEAVRQEHQSICLKEEKTRKNKMTENQNTLMTDEIKSKQKRKSKKRRRK